MHELMITQYENRTCACYYEEGVLSELTILPNRQAEQKQTSLLGNIYVGRVQNIVRNLEAAFVEIQPGLACYYSLEENKTHLVLNAKSKKALTAGDEILVQVSREASKTKAPTVSAELQLTGNLVILLYGKKRVNISRKLPSDERIRKLKAELENRLPEGFGVIVRTNAYESTDTAILEEFDALLEQLTTLIAQAGYHTVFSCLYQENTPLKRMLNDYNNEALTRIITDIPVVFEELSTLLPSGEQEKLELFQPQFQPLYAIYRFDRDWKEAVEQRVWLKSGGYLVIEQTEALTVIDVNTGKAVSKKSRQDNILKVNLEAAGEVARQLRLRNLSGIIIVDFIDMEQKEQREKLITHLCQEIKKDRIPTNFVDITRLNLVELTRKRVQKSLKEQLRERNE